ncbi:MAG: riboflavin biosynthesis protein RibF [Candidatus Amulumruptor caecigallinarius]|nr:riboflavin biosynthesis protein RibF [Candidatus Amulumruptor caecigallinarius]
MKHTLNMAMSKEVIATVGNFDGVHRGHVGVVAAMAREGRLTGRTPLVVTFDKHPLEIVAPGRAPKMLCTLSGRVKLLRNLGVEVEVVSFTPELCRLTAREWLQYLYDMHEVRALMLGYDNRFGSDGHSLTEEDLIRIGSETGMSVSVGPVVAGCSSSAARRAVAAGDMRQAAEILGRPFMLPGRVVAGRQLGRKLGFPTANIDVAPQLIMPQPGVYAADVAIEGKMRKGVVNIGVRPTVEGDGRLGVELHVAGFSGNLYGQELRVEFGARIRDERKFDSLDALKEQIKADVCSIFIQH